jgi:outer membrane protein
VAASSDILQAGAALAKAKLALSRAQGDVQKTQSVLLYTMGSSMGRQLILPDEAEPKPELNKQDLNQWLIDAQQLHPAIHSARAQFLASQAKVRQKVCLL